MSSTEQKEESKGNENDVKHIKGYRHNVDKKLSKICSDILTIMDKHLIPSFNSEFCSPLAMTAIDHRSSHRPEIRSRFARDIIPGTSFPVSALSSSSLVENTLKAPWSSSPVIHQIQSSQPYGTKGGVDSTKEGKADAISHMNTIVNSTKGDPVLIYAWIGCNSARFGRLYAAAPTRPNNTVSVANILGGSSDNTGSGIARRLVLKTGLNVILACNIPKNSPMLEADAEKKLVEKLINLGYTRPKSNGSSS